MARLPVPELEKANRFVLSPEMYSRQKLLGKGQADKYKDSRCQVVTVRNGQAGPVVRHEANSACHHLSSGAVQSMSQRSPSLPSLVAGCAP